VEEKGSRPDLSISSLRRWFAFSIERLPSILNFPLYQGKKVVSRRKKMLATSLVFGSFMTVLFLIVGIVAGWVAREYMMIHQEGAKHIAYHPEFYDNDGNFIDQEIISVRFEQEDYDYNYDTEEDDD
jgi:hypothetical protein